MPQDAAFCAVSCGSVLSRASQSEIHHSAKRGKMRQIEAAKSSRKVVKRIFFTTRISPPVCSTRKPCRSTSARFFFAQKRWKAVCKSCWIYCTSASHVLLFRKADMEHYIEHVITEVQCENRLSDWENKKRRQEERQIIRRQLRPDELPGWAERKRSSPSFPRLFPLGPCSRLKRNEKGRPHRSR